MPKTTGRIWFKDNPWQGGHAIKKFKWSARFVPGSGVWMDLHLKTENYYANDENSDSFAEEETQEQDVDPWKSKALWYNSHNCILSSTYWADDAEDADLGILAGTPESPLDLGSELHLTSDTDTSDPDHWPRHFGLYLLGHDAVADHAIRITPAQSPGRYDIEWTGRIALEGAESFDHEFEAVIKNAKFKGVKLPAKDTNSSCVQGALVCLHEPGQYREKTRKNAIWLVR